jgi:DNA ligase 1
VSQSSSNVSTLPDTTSRKRPRAISVSSDDDGGAGGAGDSSKPASKATTSAPSSKRPKRTVNDSPSSRPPDSSSIPSNITVNVLLAQTYNEKNHDPKGWWISEKMDGVRAFYTKGAFYSRLGNRFFAPDDWADDWSAFLSSLAI